MGLLKLLKIFVNKILLSPIRGNIKCPKALPSAQIYPKSSEHQEHAKSVMQSVGTWAKDDWCMVSLYFTLGLRV